ncbi:hypothetical protein [Hyphomonas jannaschiana]|uniref:Uncharacterized protein n=1 Tax=Hyphomonas jannaschiana VP2 TaxID=1280952 RepID=A0A059FF07_9PROT|nr:hypothetical protein [Hyphomonas jannaschiana]KCZ89068.1 hypothetical protein HJA_07222 [Hyphomonas jannaschiana VP2]
MLADVMKTVQVASLFGGYRFVQPTLRLLGEQMSTYDHYTEAKCIADQIEGAGFPEQAEQVRQAIENGVSGTEIFMQLRCYLSPLKNNDRIDQQVRHRVNLLVDKIDDALL